MKKKRSLFVLVAALALTGCITVGTQTRTVDLNDPYAAEKNYLVPSRERKASINDINRRARRRDAHVTLVDGRTVKARSLLMTPDSTSWFDAESGLFERVGIAEIQQIRFVRLRSRSRMIVGVLAGAALGAAIGAALGFASGDTPPGECCGLFCENGDLFCTAKERATFNAVLAGGLGGVVGAAVGGSRSQQTYYFDWTNRTKTPDKRAISIFY